MSLNVACSGEVGIGLEFSQTFIRDTKRLPFFCRPVSQTIFFFFTCFASAAAAALHHPVFLSRHISSDAVVAAAAAYYLIRL